MSIKENWPKIKYQAGVGWGKVQGYLMDLNRDDVFLVLTLCIFGTLSFGLGKLSMLEKGRQPITFETPNVASVILSATTTRETTQGLLVASRTGKNYYYPTCSGAKRIAEKNKVWFDTVEAARAKGYTPSATCEGLR